MVVINLRRIFVIGMFVAGVVTLFLGYNSAAGLLAGKPSGAESAVFSEPAGETTAVAAPLQQPAGESAAFFVNYRRDRDKTRSRQMELLKEIISDPSSAAETRKSAQEELMRIGASVSLESKIENILLARGYKEAVAVHDRKGVTVVLESPGLSPGEESGIIDMVSRETGYGEQSIIIIPRK